MTDLALATRLLPLVLSGQKTSTIRRGIRQVPLGPARLVSGDAHVQIWVTDVRQSIVDELSNEDAIREGYIDRHELLAALGEFYPNLKYNDVVTVIGFSTYDVD